MQDKIIMSRYCHLAKSHYMRGGFCTCAFHVVTVVVSTKGFLLHTWGEKIRTHGSKLLKKYCVKEEFDFCSDTQK